MFKYKVNLTNIHTPLHCNANLTDIEIYPNSGTQDKSNTSGVVSHFFTFVSFSPCVL